MESKNIPLSYILPSYDFYDSFYIFSYHFSKRKIKNCMWKSRQFSAALYFIIFHINFLKKYKKLHIKISKDFHCVFKKRKYIFLNTIFMEIRQLKNNLYFFFIEKYSPPFFLLTSAFYGGFIIFQYYVMYVVCLLVSVVVKWNINNKIIMNIIIFWSMISKLYIVFVIGLNE